MFGPSGAKAIVLSQFGSTWAHHHAAPPKTLHHRRGFAALRTRLHVNGNGNDAPPEPPFSLVFRGDELSWRGGAVTMSIDMQEGSGGALGPLVARHFEYREFFKTWTACPGPFVER